jgi:outer membrane receptor protein involved in Fe transport
LSATRWPDPEGSAYQSATPDLKPERSLNVDLGARFQANPVSAEVFVFQNRIEDGIRAAFAGDSVGQLPRYENVNVSALRMRGAEVAVSARLGAGFTADGNWSRFLSKNVSDPALKVGDVYSSKANLSLGWQPASRTWWTGYSLRRNGEQREIVAGTSPVGDVLPAFTVHSLRGGFSLRTRGGLRQDIGLHVNNLTNALYAEVANRLLPAGTATELRPQRHDLVLTAPGGGSLAIRGEGAVRVRSPVDTGSSASPVRVPHDPYRATRYLPCARSGPRTPAGGQECRSYPRR